MLASPAFDPDYERLADSGHYELQWWWPLRQWRRVFVRRLMWGKCAAPPDPDAALAPDADNPFRGGYTWGSDPQTILDALEQTGPSTVSALAPHVPMSRNSLEDRLRALVRDGTVVSLGFGRAGDPRSRTYGLPGQTLLPPEQETITGTLSAVYAVLSDSGDWLTANEIAARGGITAYTVRRWLRANAPAIETCTQMEKRHAGRYGQMVKTEITYFRLRAGDGQRLRQED